MRDRVLYHYTSFSTFQKIISNQSIRLSSLVSGNDPSEGYIPTKLMRQAKRSHSDPDVAILAKCIEDTLRRTIPLGFCMSRETDLVHQWSMYADDSKGVAIGFSKSNLENYLSQKSSEFPVQKELVTVEYNKNAQRKWVDEWLVRFFEKGADKKSVLYELVDKQYVFKDRSFKQEKEVRILSAVLNISDMEVWWNEVLQNGEAQVCAPHVDLSLKGCLNSTIRKIILGPNCISSKDEVEEFLANHELEPVKVKVSESPYRPK